MTVLNYKGYQGSVTWEDGVNAIRVLHIDHLLIDHCRDAARVKATFHGLIDEYIETCKKLGREPEKPFKGSFNVRISPDLHRQAAMAATTAGISLNAWIVDAVREKLQDAPGNIAWSGRLPIWQFLAGATFAGGVQVAETLQERGATAGEAATEVVASLGTSRRLTETWRELVTAAGNIALVGPSGTTGRTLKIRPRAAGASSDQLQRGQLRSGAEQ